jgi:hypothetical protein
MKSLTYTLFVLLLSANVFAVEIPNQFEDGQVTSASQMNENFQALKVEIEALKAQLEQSQNPPKVEFQGYSEPISGNSGIAEFSVACEAVTAGSRMCIGDELINSIFEYPSDRAWIARNRTSANTSTGGTHTVTKAFYGKTSSCISDDVPHTIASNGRFYDSINNGCHSLNIFPIACCK